MKSFERAQMVYLDALVEAPTYAITLTTRSPVWDGARYREGKAQLLRNLRAEFVRVEALEFIEQTTGKAPRSGGRRRGHGHNLIRGLPPGHALVVERICLGTWKRVTGAWHVNVSELQSVGGAVAYLTLNLALEKGKEAQAPTDLPPGTRTFRATRGYWSRPARDLRQDAREYQVRRRIAWRLLNEGVPASLVSLAVESAMDARTRTTSEVWRYRLTGRGLLVPLGPMKSCRP
jgi:hypothetical protein